MSSFLTKIISSKIIKKRNIFDPDPEELIHASLPLDHSFKNIVLLSVARKNPRTCRLLRLPPLGKTSGKFVTRSLWLDNNTLKDLNSFEAFIGRQFDQPEALMWLDLSFNKLCDVPEEILLYPNLKILYLHGNDIQALTPLSVLRKVKTLQSLTLRGNPVEKIYAYRALIITLLPQIIRLDYALITDYERESLLPVCFGTNLVKQIISPKKTRSKF